MAADQTTEFHLGMLPDDLVEEVSVEEGRELFDEAARFHTGLSGPEFLEKWDAGELDRNDPNVVHVAMLIPFVRAEW